MTDDTDTAVDIDLDTFEADFFGKTSPEPVDEPNEVVENDEEDIENEDNPLAPDEDEEDPDTEEDEGDEDEEEEVEELPKPHRNRKSAKARIEELVAKNREAERREAELQRRLAAVEAQIKTEAESKTQDIREVLPKEAPHPDAKGEDGEPLYELGEFDPKYITDLTKFTIEQETKAARERETQERQATEMARVQHEIAEAWIERVDEVEQEIPELRENMKTLTDTFDTIDPNYGEYLASTIMISEVGPQIMNYLSQNIGEAQKIVASGPAAATLALGRLEARLLNSSTNKDEKRNQKQVSQASEPPEDRARGRGGKFAIAPDTDNLDAFEREFYKK